MAPMGSIVNYANTDAPCEEGRLAREFCTHSVGAGEASKVPLLQRVDPLTGYKGMARLVPVPVDADEDRFDLGPVHHVVFWRHRLDPDGDYLVDVDA